MTPVERTVRAAVYQWIIDEVRGPSVDDLAKAIGYTPEVIREALQSLEDAHLLAMTPARDSVMMAHPFSGIETGFEAVVGNRTWNANCAWDSLAILALMGDGKALADPLDPELVWSVSDGVVEPDGLIHLRVPAKSFWDDIGFT